MDERQENSASRIRVTLEIDHELCLALEKLKKELGLKSRGFLINRLLRELLLDENQDSQHGHVTNHSGKVINGSIRTPHNWQNTAQEAKLDTSKHPRDRLNDLHNK